MSDEGYGIGDIVAKTGAKQRSVLMWADALALWPQGGTGHAGRGVHRRFSWTEVQIAAVLHHVAPFRLPIGTMAAVGSIVRLMILSKGLPAERGSPARLADAVQAVVRGERNDVEIVITPAEQNGSRPFDFFMQWRGDDQGEQQRPRGVAMIINLVECWKGLSS
jgi:hypothetical protein